jgi:hypothetical protein
LASTTLAAITTSRPISTWGSFLLTASTSSVPMPCRLNTVSVMIAPVTVAPKVTENSVITGISALRDAWRQITRERATPLARASPTPVAEDVREAQLAHPGVGADRVALEHDGDAEDRHREHQRRRRGVPDRVLPDGGEHAHQDRDRDARSGDLRGNGRGGDRNPVTPAARVQAFILR